MNKFKDIEALIKSADKKGFIFDLAREVTGFYDITIDDINKMYDRPTDLLNDPTNIVEVCKEADENGFEHIWMSGSIYNRNFWTTGTRADCFESAAESLRLLELESLIDSYNYLEKTHS